MGELIRLQLPDTDNALYVELDDAPCPTFPCPSAQPCTDCFLPVCPRHSDPEAVIPCVEGGWHHADCAQECEPCLSEEW
jgi:hypothetical protein